MKLRDKILYMSFGAGLVVLGMILNSLVSGDAEAQVGVKDATGYITCKGLVIKDGYKERGYFRLRRDGSVMLGIYGDDGRTVVAYLGKNKKGHDEMMFNLTSKSTTDKREVSMVIDPNGGKFDSLNKMGESVVRIAVGNDGGGILDLRDKFGNKR